jgi:hypothetical protein
MSDIETAKLDRTIIGQSMNRKKRKRARRTIREMINYTDDHPVSCCLCRHYQSALTVDGAYFQPRCTKFLIGVVAHAVCDNYEDI